MHFMDIKYSYKRDSDEGQNEFLKSVSHYICFAISKEKTEKKKGNHKQI